jgi:hypothetical protein
VTPSRVSFANPAAVASSAALMATLTTIAAMRASGGGGDAGASRQSANSKRGEKLFHRHTLPFTGLL